MNNCPNCGSNINQGEAFCRNCGTKMPIPQNNIMNNMQQPQPINNINNINTQPTIPMNNQQVNNGPVTNFDNPNINTSAVQRDYESNEVLIDAYIGKNADNLKNKGFSWCTFLFGFLYPLYRKMWLIGFGWFAINSIVNMFLSKLASLITLIVGIIASIQFKKWYLTHVEEEVNKIKTENPSKTQEELIAICKKKGGTTVVPVIVAILIYGGIMYYAFSAIFTALNGNNPNNYNEPASVNTNTNTGNGLVGNLDVTIPSTLTATTQSNTIASYHTEDYKCSLMISGYAIASTYNNDAQAYLEKHVYYSASDTYSGISNKTINGKTWNYVSVTKSYGTTHYYATIDGEKIYEIEFSENSDTCAPIHNAVVNSLRFK